MTILRGLRKLVYGETLIPQEFTLALPDPQAEIRVRLAGLGEPADGTRRITTACCAPLMFAVSMEKPRQRRARRASLQYRRSEGDQELLGEIHLTLADAIPLDRSELLLFRVRGSANCCLPKPRLWAHHLSQAYLNRRNLKSFDVQMTSREMRAAIVSFIRPHPLMLGSIAGEAGGNIFPMNLLGEVGDGYFGFALKDSRRPAHLIEQTRRLALSSVPMPLCSTAFRLAANHTRDAIDWNELPFALKESREFRIPVPSAAPRVRELEVAQVRKLGSHTFFVARIVSDERFSDEPQVHMIHGFYQCWRMRGRREMLETSIEQDRLNKRGPAPSRPTPIYL